MPILPVLPALSAWPTLATLSHCTLDASRLYIYPPLPTLHILTTLSALLYYPLPTFSYQDDSSSSATLSHLTQTLIPYSLCLTLPTLPTLSTLSFFTTPSSAPSPPWPLQYLPSSEIWLLASSTWRPRAPCGRAQISPAHIRRDLYKFSHSHYHHKPYTTGRTGVDQETARTTGDTNSFQQKMRILEKNLLST
jgi:hypothetical protein